MEFLDDFKPTPLSSPELIQFYDKSSNNAFPLTGDTVRVIVFIIDADSYHKMNMYSTFVKCPKPMNTKK